MERKLLQFSLVSKNSWSINIFFDLLPVLGIWKKRHKQCWWQFLKNLIYILEHITLHSSPPKEEEKTKLLFSSNTLISNKHYWNLCNINTLLFCDLSETLKSCVSRKLHEVKSKTWKSINLIHPKTLEDSPKGTK